MIHAEGLTKVFDDFVAVNQVSFSVAEGRVLALLGKNGAGKTTTIRMLSSLLKPTQGSARVAGYDIVREAQKVRASVGVLTEHHGLYSRMSLWEYLEFFGSLYGMTETEVRRRARPLLEEFELNGTEKKRLGEFSKGMRQKLALVRAILHNPPVLMLDEPTSAMDPESARVVRNAIAHMRGQGRTILLCTHNLVEGEELADDVAIIHRGRIILQGALEEVKEQQLGAPEFLARLAHPLNGVALQLPEGVTVTARGEDWVRFQVAHPRVNNPELLRALFHQQVEVLSFQEVPRSLEEVFLKAIRMEKEDVD
ncbi:MULTISPECIES: ABC transporter ATP-binding protein [Anaerolinea]|uniref:ABC transporter ATP-binding protein n=1 Tax=Anaerolinea TaxID=233189 RepID=UPI00260F23B0|nr:ABC transporter ATP-binding protein [Anaerolinea thermophila]